MEEIFPRSSELPSLDVDADGEFVSPVASTGISAFIKASIPMLHGLNDRKLRISLIQWAREKNFPMGPREIRRRRKTKKSPKRFSMSCLSDGVSNASAPSEL